ncbi:hypothetical protein [Streptosporangium sp. NPDC049376]|uniref:hypothetical protein n=1 Tax=Streptosporangium sp. NPDC049376 TaxID=3366192 RepID=UPI0037BACE4C
MVSTAYGRCWALTANCPVPGPVPAGPANRDYRPGFAAALMAKDLGPTAGADRSSGWPPSLVGARPICAPPPRSTATPVSAASSSPAPSGPSPPGPRSRR